MKNSGTRSRLEAVNATWRAAGTVAALALLLFLAACSSEPKVFDRDDDSPAAINARLGLNYMQQGSYDVALEKLRRALQQDPKLPEAHHYSAELYRTLGNHELAEEHYRQALKLSPDNPALQNNFGVFLCGRARYDEAEERFLRASRMPSYQRPDEAFQNAALCALRKPDLEKAEKYFRQALDINPVLPKSLYQMALLSYDTGQYMQARGFVQRYAAVAPHTPQSLWLAVRIERRLGNESAAQRHARELREKFPDAEQTAELDESEG